MSNLLFYCSSWVKTVLLYQRMAENEIAENKDKDREVQDVEDEMYEPLLDDGDPIC